MRISDWSSDVCSSDLSLGLSGWVRNRSDGTVEAVVAGRAAAIKRFISLAHEGPPAAHVTRIDERDEDEGAISSSETSPTAYDRPDNEARFRLTYLTLRRAAFPREISVYVGGSTVSFVIYGWKKPTAD